MRGAVDDSLGSCRIKESAMKNVAFTLLCFTMLVIGAAPAWEARRMEVCYVGGISTIRGIRELVRACELLQTPARLSLVGSFSEPALEQEVAGYAGWQRVDAHGHLDRAGVQAAMGRAMAGLVTLHPVANHLNALPVKMMIPLGICIFPTVLMIVLLPVVIRMRGIFF